jgi:hypothetical protein
MNDGNCIYRHVESVDEAFSLIRSCIGWIIYRFLVLAVMFISPNRLVIPSYRIDI